MDTRLQITNRRSEKKLYIFFPSKCQVSVSVIGIGLGSNCDIGISIVIGCESSVVPSLKSTNLATLCVLCHPCSEGTFASSEVHLGVEQGVHVAVNKIKRTFRSFFMILTQETETGI